MAEDTNLRRTRQRRKLLDILGAKPEPLTADQILRICQLECPNMALTTVYRNLDRMIELGYATKIESAQGAARFAASTPETRMVLICRVCQARAEVRGLSAEGIEAELEKRTGYEIEHRYLEFYGLCPRCRAGEHALRGARGE